MDMTIPDQSGHGTDVPVWMHPHTACAEKLVMEGVCPAYEVRTTDASISSGFEVPSCLSWMIGQVHAGG